jgi:hypothetical protein
MATYTVTEALVKLKLAQKKIDAGIANTLTGVIGSKGTSTMAPAGFKNTEEFKNEVKKRLDSVCGLIDFRNRLKKAIVESNAKTTVVVGSKNMTVAEAIETKNSIESTKNLLSKLVSDWTTLESLVNQKNASLETRADQYVTQLFQMNAGASEADKASARKNFIENNMNVIVTYENTRNLIEKLKNDIDEFESNVDVALSVVNATTSVTLSD